MMDFTYGWLLNLIVYLPLVGALLMMLFIKKENSSALKGFATVVAALDFVISIPLVVPLQDRWRGVPVRDPVRVDPVGGRAVSLRQSTALPCC